MNTKTENQNENLNATYSLEDNKLRLYCHERLDDETYKLVHSQGFRWAPRQKLFVAPKWTPGRANLLIKLCGEIEDEQTSVEERAKQRAARFSTYQEKRQDDGDQAYHAVKEITDRIPFGQPILIGHHSQRRAERDQKRIENGRQRAVQMWQTSDYWKERAQDVISHAQYKERTDVRARRVKKLEAEKRKYAKTIEKSEAMIKVWTNPEKELTWERARSITNYHDHLYGCFPLDKYPRGKDKPQYEGSTSLWSALEFITPEQARELALKSHKRTIEYYKQWLKHTDFRLMYEKEILNAQGYKEPEKKKRPKLSPIVNFRMEETKEMTRAEYAKIGRDYKGCKNSKCGTYRYREVYLRGRLSSVFLTDQKIVEPSKEPSVACS